MRREIKERTHTREMPRKRQYLGIYKNLTLHQVSTEDRTRELKMGGEGKLPPNKGRKKGKNEQRLSYDEVSKDTGVPEKEEKIEKN